MRTISLTMRRALAVQDSGEVAVVLLTISHPMLPAPIRVSSDPTQRLSLTPVQYGTVSRGQTYLFCPLSVSLPDDVGERAPAAQIQIENVSRDLIALARSTATRATVRLELVLASTPDTVEVPFPQFDLGSVSYTADAITLELAIDSMTNFKYPAGTFDPASFPALFG